MLTIFSLFYWIFAAVSCMVLFIPAFLIWLLTFPFDKRLRILHQYSCFWASIYVTLNPLWRLKTEGREKINKGETYVMISNHQSILDILVLYSLFIHFKWVSKLENFRLPFVGWTMSLNRYIRLDRSSTKSFMKMMRDSEKNLNEGNSVMIFPEGTRSLTHDFRTFKEGAFHLALKSKKPILPIILNGTGDAAPKKGFVFRKNKNLRVRVLDPVPYSEFANLSPAGLTKKMRDLMTEAHQKLLNEIKNE
jgi:1-acyl-sn-glycerol-3-phosphate acyltransferase